MRHQNLSALISGFLGIQVGQLLVMYIHAIASQYTRLLKVGTLLSSVQHSIHSVRLAPKLISLQVQAQGCIRLPLQLIQMTLTSLQWDLVMVSFRFSNPWNQRYGVP